MLSSVTHMHSPGLQKCGYPIRLTVNQICFVLKLFILVDFTPAKMSFEFQKKQRKKNSNSLEIRTVVHPCSTQISIAYDVRMVGNAFPVYFMCQLQVLCVSIHYTTGKIN